MRPLPFLFLLVLAASLGACGESHSEREIAWVGRTAIEEEAFVEIFPSFVGTPGWTAADALSRRPDVSACAEQIGEQQSLPPGGVRRACLVGLRIGKREALRFLIGRVWLRHEAKRRGVELSGRELSQEVQRARGSAPSAEAFKATLAGRKMSLQQFSERVEVESLSRRLAKVIFQPDLRIDDDEVRAYYSRNSSYLDVPAQRLLRAVISPSRRDVVRAATALRSGATWPTVVRRFSADPSRREEGRLVVRSDNVFPNLRETVFSAPIGKPTGPVQLPGGWWLFEVEKATHAHRPSLEEAARRVREDLVAQRESVALGRLSRYLHERYRPLTTCAPRFQVPQCARP